MCSEALSIADQQARFLDVVLQGLGKTTAKFSIFRVLNIDEMVNCFVLFFDADGAFE